MQGSDITKFNTNWQDIALQILLSHIIAQSKNYGESRQYIEHEYMAAFAIFHRLSLPCYITASLENSEFLKDDETFC